MACFVPHGGGPLPLLGDPGHTALVKFLSRWGRSHKAPKAALVVSAHWQEAVPTVGGGAHPSLLYDYYGFSADAYKVTYPAPGSPELAARVNELLRHREQR